MTLGSLPAKSNVKDIEREDLKNKRRGRGGGGIKEPTKNQEPRINISVMYWKCRGLQKRPKAPGIKLLPKDVPLAVTLTSLRKSKINKNSILLNKLEDAHNPQVLRALPMTFLYLNPFILLKHFFSSRS